MQFMDQFDGVASITITSAYPAGALQKIQDAGICIYDVSAHDAFRICFSAKRKDIRSITRICEKRGDRIDIEGWTGYIFYILSLLKRPLFLSGLLCWLFFALWLPTRILFVSVLGADRISDTYILECAADCGIRMGASGKEVRSEQVKNALLSKIPTLQWAGVNTSGCIATICVQEKTPKETSLPKVAITDILSTQDAIVKEITVHAGTALCQPGQAVKKGQALISCYQDNGQMLRFTGARGEVFGESKRYLQAITPLQAYKRTKILSRSVKNYVVIGKNPINFHKDSGILDASCVKMYEVKECVLPGGFALPILLVREYIIKYAIEPVVIPSTDLGWLSDYIEDYLENDLIAGNILSSQISTEQTDDTFSIYGTYDCKEMIADYECKGILEEDGENS